MIRLIASFLVFIYSFFAFSPALPYIEYLVNQNYIASTLCINKGQPELKCNGKCYLMTKIKEAAEEKERKDFPQPIKTQIKLVPFFQDSLLELVPFYEIRETLTSFNQIFYYPAISFSIFHPPQYIE